VTIEIPDDVHAAATAKARELKIPLWDYVTEAVDEKIRRLKALKEERSKSRRSRDTGWL
jgi:hypothetical protein